MKKMQNLNLNIFVALSLIVLLLFGCTVKQTIKGGEKAGFDLFYRLDKDQRLNYEFNTKIDNRMKIRDQETITKEDSRILCSMVGTEANQPDQLSSQVTIDDMQMKTLQTAGGESGEIERDLSNVIGKSFNLTFSPQGKEIDYSGIEKITIDYGPMNGGEQSVINHFRDMFPNLPTKVINIGETWTETVEETRQLSKNASMKIILNLTSTIEDHEIINGYKCLRIQTKASGNLKGSNRQRNNFYYISGDITNEVTWYFAYQKGLLVKSLSKAEMQLKIYTNLTIPMIIKITDEKKLTTPL